MLARLKSWPPTPNPMTIFNSNQGNSTDAYLQRAFSWLARIGACPKFGSRPIGWYQIHAMHALHALKLLESTKACGFPVRCKAGVIQYKPTIGAWQNVITARELFDQADKLTRS